MLQKGQTTTGQRRPAKQNKQLRALSHVHELVAVLTSQRLDLSACKTAERSAYNSHRPQAHARKSHTRAVTNTHLVTPPPLASLVVLAFATVLLLTLALLLLQEREKGPRGRASTHARPLNNPNPTHTTQADTNTERQSDRPVPSPSRAAVHRDPVASPAGTKRDHLHVRREWARMCAVSSVRWCARRVCTATSADDATNLRSFETA